MKFEAALSVATALWNPSPAPINEPILILDVMAAFLGCCSLIVPIMLEVIGLDIVSLGGGSDSIKRKI